MRMVAARRVPAAILVCGVLACTVLLVGTRHASAAHTRRLVSYITLRPLELPSRFTLAGTAAAERERAAKSPATPCSVAGSGCVVGCTIPVAAQPLPAPNETLPCKSAATTRPCDIPVSNAAPAPPTRSAGAVCQGEALGHVEHNHGTSARPRRR
jgi:hypothetical protein